jgi:hypothetical protein
VKKKPTAADRPEFRRDVADIVHKLGIQPAEITQDVMLVCMRAADFDPNDNVLWELEANKSAVRPDVHCTECESLLAMSNHAYKRYSGLDKKPKVCCVQCMVEVVGREERSTP